MCHPLPDPSKLLINNPILPIKKKKEKNKINDIRGVEVGMKNLVALITSSHLILLVFKNLSHIKSKYHLQNK